MGRGRSIEEVEVADVKAKVLEALRKAGKPLRPGEIAELAGLDKDEVSKAIKELKAEGKVHSPKRCFYAPK
jgi:DNA-binding IclR family transcriptional regulator